MFKSMKPFHKVLVINLIILIVYFFLYIAYHVTQSNNDGYDIILLAMFIGLHFIAAVLAGILFLITGKKEVGLALVLSAFLALVVGFSGCYGIGTMMS